MKERVNTLEKAGEVKTRGFQQFAPLSYVPTTGARANTRVGCVDRITRATVITKTRPAPYWQVLNSKESCQSEKKRVKRTLEVGSSC